MKTWHLFVWLVITAVVYYYVGKLIVWLVLIYFLFRGWVWLGRHYPHVTWFIIGFVRGLLK